MSGNITETLRNLEKAYQEKEILVHYFHKNENATREVQRLLKNDNKSIKRQECHSGNIWEKCRVLETNIELCNLEMNYYEKVLGLPNTIKPR